MTLTPGEAYTIPIPLPTSQPQVALQGYAKNVADTQPYTIDPTNYLTAMGLTITGAPTVVCGSSDVTISGVETTQGLTTFLLSGGVNGSTYPIVYSATLSSGTLTRTIWIQTLDASPNTSQPVIIAIGPPGPQGEGGGSMTGQEIATALINVDISSANASPDEGETEYTLGSIAGLARAALTAAALATTALSYPAPGGFGAAHIGSTGYTQNSEGIGAAVAKGAFRTPRSFQNSTTSDARVPGTGTAVPTTGVWLSQEHYEYDFVNGNTTNVSPVINPAIIWQAAVNWCSAVNSPTVIKNQGGRAWILLNESGDYPNFTQVVIPDAGNVFINSLSGQPICRLICPFDTKLTTYGLGDGLFINQSQETSAVRCRNVVLSGFALAKAFTDATDTWSGLFTADLLGDWTANAGDWTGITPVFSAVASSNANAIAAMANGTYVVYFDQTGTDTGGNPTITVQLLSGTPGNRTYAAPVSWSLSQFQAAITAAAATHGLAGYNQRYIGSGCTVTSVAYSTLSGHTGFQVTFADPVNPEAAYTTGAIQTNFPTPKPAQTPSIVTQSAPERIAQPAIPAPSIIFHTGQWSGGNGVLNPLTVWNGAPVNYPYMARGHALNLVVDNLLLDGLSFMGFSQGQCLLEGGGYNVVDLNCTSTTNDMRQDTGGIRWHQGTAYSYGVKISSGDQCIEPQTGVKFTQQGTPKPWDNQPVQAMIVFPNVSCPDAAGIALASDIPNQSQAIVCTGGAVTANTSTQGFVAGSFNALPYVTGGGSMAYAANIGNLYYGGGTYNPANCPGGTVNSNQTHTNNNNFLSYVGNGPTHCIPGSFVIGYSDSGGSTGSLGNTGTPNGIGPFTLVYAPPQSSYGSQVFGRSIAAPRMQFSFGIPVGALTCLNNVTVYGGSIKSGAKTCCVQVHNGDDQLSNRLTMFGTVINGWWQSNNGSAGINCTGSNFGGAVLALYGVKIFDPGYQSISTSGIMNYYSDPACVFGQPQNGRVPGMAFNAGPAAYLAGIAGGLVQGEFQAMLGGSALQLGDVDTALSVSTPSPNNSTGSKLDNAKLKYLVDGQPGLIVNNSANIVHGDVQYIQATNLGSGSAIGISLLGNTGNQPTQAPTNFRFRAGDFSQIDGAAIIAGTGATWVLSGYDQVWGTSGSPGGAANTNFVGLVAQAVQGVTVSNTYTTAGAISPSDVLSLVVLSGTGTMTLANGGASVHVQTISNGGSGQITVTVADFYGSSGSVLITSKMAAILSWQPALGYWIRVG